MSNDLTVHFGEVPFTKEKRVCVRGHAMVAANMTFNGGVKMCRLCRNEREAERRKRVACGVVIKQDRSQQKVCKRGHDLTAENTYINKGHRSCRTCRRLYKKHARKNKLAFMRTEYRRENLKRYGITLEIYQEMFSRQRGVCAICKNPTNHKYGRRLDVDHDHATGIVRGLLCCKCNRGLGYFRDNADYLIQAALYLQSQTIQGGAS